MNMIRIPKIIHQTWCDENLPPLFRRLSETWKEMLPDWEYRLWTDEMNHEFVKTHYPDFLPKYEAYPKNIQRADAIRYLLLQTYGGLYVDLDFECLKPEFADLLENVNFIAGKEPYSHARRYRRDFIICNALMASVPEHPFLKYVCRRMMSHPLGWNVKNGIDIVESTGPFLLTEAYRSFVRKDDIRIVEPELLYPIKLGEADSVIARRLTMNQKSRIEKASAMHYFVGTWHNPFRMVARQMRIIQTFWTGNHNVLHNFFGWKASEYNLMSWAMSCMSLRKYYDNVVLYTDSAGKRLLIDTLHLPYTEVHVIFDDFHCLPQHWALSKIRTYSMQAEPFIHVDGDIIITEPLLDKVMNTPLLAQNREKGTSYYRNMVTPVVKEKDIKLPNYVEVGLKEESIASYNMGFFGGTDIDFIHRYCHEVFRFVEENHMNDIQNSHSRINCNVLLEQIFFALMAECEKRQVTCILKDEIRDNGYTTGRFCDLEHYGKTPFYHILGGHKRNDNVITMVNHAMLRLYPELYYQILSLFPESNLRFANPISVNNDTNNYCSVTKSIESFDQFVEYLKKEWKDIPNRELLYYAEQTARAREFAEEPPNERNLYSMHYNQYCRIFHIPSDWDPKAIKIIKQQLGYERQYPLSSIAMIPVLEGDGIEMAQIINMDYNIIQALQESKMPYQLLKKELIKKNKMNINKDNINLFEDFILQEVLILMKRGIIYFT